MWKKHMWTSGFYRYEHIYSYKRREFQNILEINLCNCFRQLLLIYLKKMLNMELNMILWIVLMESAYIRHSWNLRSGRFIETLQYKQDDQFDGPESLGL